MAIVVTGGCGFLGAKLVARLVADGQSVVVLDDLSTGSIDNLPSGIKMIQGCVTDRATVRRALKDVDLIFHLASVVGQNKVQEDPGWACRVSEISTRILMDEAPGTALVQFSSSAVYGLATQGACEESLAIPEATPLAYDGGVPGYAVGKWRAERVAIEKKRGSRVLIIRPFNVVGPGQLNSYGMVIPQFIENAFNGLPMRIYGDGRQSRCFSASWVFIDILLDLVDKWLAGNLKYNVFNLATSEETSIAELANVIERQCAMQVKRTFIPYDEVYPGKSDVQRRIPSITRLNEAVGEIYWPSIVEIIARVTAERR